MCIRDSICKDENAVLAASEEESSAFTNSCFSGNETVLSIFSPSNTNLNQKIALYPIPVTNELILELEVPTAISKIEILDMNGRLLLSQPGTTNKKTQLDTSLLSNGSYIFRIFDKDGQKNESIKFIK